MVCPVSPLRYAARSYCWPAYAVPDFCENLPESDVPKRWRGDTSVPGICVNSRPRAGATRAQHIEHLTRRLDPSTWDLIRHGVLSHVLYKVGVEPGFFGVLNAPSIEEANKIIAAGVERLELFDLEVVPVNQFPQLRLNPRS
jgi:hypothetical protein